MEKAIFREYKRIIVDNALLYGKNFVSTNSDFYTNKERRESYGCLVANMLYHRLLLEVSTLLWSCLTVAVNPPLTNFSMMF